MKKSIGYIFIIISAVSFSTLAILGRYAYESGVDTFTLLFLRFLIAALILGGIQFLRREPLPPYRDLVKLAAMGGIGYVAQSFCFLTAIRFASAGLVALLLYLYPVFVAVWASIFLKERITGWKGLALLLAVIGTALTGNPQGGQPLGIALAIASALIYSVYIVIGFDVMKRVTAVQSSTIIFASATIIFGILVIINGLQLPSSPTGWWAILGISIMATVVPVITFLAGIKYIGPTDASMLSTFEPIATVLLAVLLFGEILEVSILVGGGLILSAAIILVRSGASSKKNRGMKVLE